jgi:radical SAM protein with 4Fe4S-binding SPASM domain
MPISINTTQNVKHYTSDHYYSVLYHKYGASFLDYRERWTRSISDQYELDGPIHIDLELLNSCNYKCSFCPYSLKPSARPEGFQATGSSVLDFNLACRILIEARELGACAIELGYNTEPLLYPKIIDLIKFASSIGYIDIRMGSNGSLLSPDISQQLIRSGLTQLQVSVDAVDSESYKASRNSDNYELISSNIKKFVDIRNSQGNQLPVLRLTYVMTTSNAPKADIFVSQWSDIAEIVSLQTLLTFNGMPDEVSSGLTSDIKASSGEYDIQGCYMPKVRLSVKSDGTVRPCCTVPGMALDVGDLNQQSVAQVWHSEIMSQLRQMHSNNTWQQNKVCKECLLGFVS